MSLNIKRFIHRLTGGGGEQRRGQRVCEWGGGNDDVDDDTDNDVEDDESIVVIPANQDMSWHRPPSFLLPSSLFISMCMCPRSSTPSATSVFPFQYSPCFLCLLPCLVPYPVLFPPRLCSVCFLSPLASIHVLCFSAKSSGSFIPLLSSRHPTRQAGRAVNKLS